MIYSKTFDIFVSLFSPFFLYFMLGVLADASLNIYGGVAWMLLFLFLRIFLLTGTYVALCEIVVGEEILFSFRKTFQLAARFLGVYIAFCGGMFVIHFLLFHFLAVMRSVSLQSFFVHTDLLIQYLFLSAVFKRKNIVPEKRLSVNHFLVLTFLSGANVALYYFVENNHFSGRVINAIGFLRDALQIVLFIFVALSMSPKRMPDRHFFKEILLINPFGAGMLRSIGYAWFARAYPPFFVVLKALTPKHYRFHEFNQTIWFNRYFQSGKLVAITSYTSNCFEAYRLAKEFKRRGSTVVMGGPHVTYLSEEALSFCDSVVVGDAEGVWPKIIEDYEHNRLQKVYSGKDLNDLGHNRVYEYLKESSPEIIKDFLETSRGCKFKCHFCTVPALSHGEVVNQNTFELVELLKKVGKRYKSVTFIDNNIYNDPGYTKELFRALKPLNLKWRTACTIDIAKNEETLKLAKEAGCEYFLIGYEVSDQSLKKTLRGKFSMAEQYADYTRRIQKLGITIRANFILGFEEDRLKNVFRMWRYCVGLGVRSAGLSFLTPLPGAEFFGQLMKENRITNLNWRRYDMFHLLFRHKYLTSKQIDHFFAPISATYLLTASSSGRILLGLLLIGLILTIRLMF